MEFITGRINEVTHAITGELPVSPSPTQPNSPDGRAAPAEAEYMDKRGILMTSSPREGSNSNGYAEQTLQILREQLIKDGKTPLEFIPLEDIKKEMAIMFEKANNDIPYDEARLDYLIKCLDLNPDHKAEKAKETVKLLHLYTTVYARISCPYSY